MAAPNGCEYSTRTVWSSITLQPAYGPSWVTAPSLAVAGSAMVSKVNLTASALNGVPSWKAPSGRSLSVTDLPSGACSHAVARPGNSLLEPSDEISVSNTCAIT